MRNERANKLQGLLTATVSSDPLDELTAREREVLALLGAGRTNRQIAEALVVSQSTAERHVHNILMKLGCANRTEAAALLRGNTFSGLSMDPSEGVLRVRSEAAPCPYPGLRPFRAEDAGGYVGHRESVERALELISTRGLVLVTGSSGSGKSSLLAAGLLPALQTGALPGSADWTYSRITPGAEPLESLAMVSAGLIRESPVTALRELESDERALQLALSGAAAASGPEFRLLLFIDQLEELFTLCTDSWKRSQFIDAIVHAAGREGKLVLVMALRGDFYGHCGAFPELARLIEQSHILLGPLSREELREAIELPAARAGVPQERGLTERILADLGNAPGGLPLLAHALRETWDVGRGREMTISGYSETGGIHGSVAATAEKVLQNLTPDEQPVCREIFLRLVQTGDGGDDTARRVTFDELAGTEIADDRFASVVQRLADVRLVTVGADGIDLAHEALLRAWPRLREWLDEDREGLRQWRHLTQAAKAWSALDREPGELYRGVRLGVVLEWAGRRSPLLSPLEREFLEASQAAQDRERADAARRVRRLRRLVAVFASLVVAVGVTAGAALFLWRETTNARDSERKATGEALRQRDVAEQASTEATLARLETEIPVIVQGDRSLAFGLAAAAHEMEPGARTDALLSEVLGEDPRYLGRIFPSTGEVVTGYAISPDGKTIALRAGTGLFELQDAASGAVITSINAEPTSVVAQLIFAPGGDTILSATSHQVSKKVTIVLRDLLELTEVRRLEFNDVEAFASRSQLTPDGEFWFTLNGSLHVLETVSWTDVRQQGLPPVYQAPSLDPLGRYISLEVEPFGSARRVALFDARTFELIRTLPAIPSSHRFTSEGYLLISSIGPGGGAPGRVDLWDPDTGDLLGTVPTQFDSGILGLNDDGTAFAIATGVEQLSVFSIPEMERVAAPYDTFTIARIVPAFGPGDRTLYNNAWTFALEYWALDGMGLASTVSEATGPGTIAVAPDGTWFVKQSPDGHWSRWRLPSLSLIDRSMTTSGDAALKALPAVFPSPAISSDGRYFATGHSDCGQPATSPCAGNVVIWDSDTGKQVGKPVPVPETGSPSGIILRFHPDKPLLAINATKHSTQLLENGVPVVIVSLERGQPEVWASFRVPSLTTASLQFFDFVSSSISATPTLLVMSGPEISAWEIGPGSARQVGTTWHTGATVRGTAVLRDGRVALLRTSGDLQFVPYASILTGGEPDVLRTVPAVAPPQTSALLEFSSDESRIAIRMGDGSVAVWDVLTGKSLGENFAWQSATSANILADGTLLVAGEQSIVLWNMDTTVWPVAVCRAAGRNLTLTEWAKYFPGKPYDAPCEQWPDSTTVK